MPVDVCRCRFMGILAAFCCHRGNSLKLERDSQQAIKSLYYSGGAADVANSGGILLRTII